MERSVVRQSLWFSKAVSHDVVRSGRFKERPVAICRSQGPSQPKKGFGHVDEEKKGKKPGRDAGSKGKQKAVTIREGSKNMQNLINSLEKEHETQQHKKLNIDPEVAAKGKVDFVQVESWGNLETDSEAGLENLKMKAFSSGFDQSDYAAPFYEQLVRRIQLLESKGEISIVQAQTQPLPAFEKWIFGVGRYVQFLVDQRAVHEALESVIESIYQGAGDAAGAASAVFLFRNSLGLHRAQAIAEDLKGLSPSSSHLPEPSTQTLAYAKYIQRLGKLASGSDQESKGACLRLLAHIFSIHIAHLTTGMRVGSKALEDLAEVRSAKAVAFYRDYPQEASDPLKSFIQACNKAGKCISKEEDLEQVMQELGKAIQKTSLLLSTLAVVEQAVLVK